MNDVLRSALEEGVRAARAPGAVLLVGRDDEPPFLAATGDALRSPRREPVRVDTLYDLASLTKVVATTTAVMVLRDAGELRLTQTARDFIPLSEFGEITLEHLLLHTAGFTNRNPFYREVSTVDELIERYAREGIEHAPGEGVHYCDAAFLVLGRIVELAARQSLDAFCRETIFDPAGMTDTLFNPPPDVRARCAATERCPWRGRVMHGEVHDENAYAVGGVAGHAGLFSTAEDLGRFCRTLLNESILSAASIREMTRMGRVASYTWQAYGWEVDPWHSKKKGYLPSRVAFGHTGWTGTSLWIDPERGNHAVLLSNTPHPNRKRMNNEALRRPIHDAIQAELYPRAANVHSGLDRVVRENFSVVRKRRIGLLTNHAATDVLGRGILEVLDHAPEGVDLRVLFSPEHGLKGVAEAGETVPSGRWQGVPVVSLYGAQKAPTADQLRDIDLLLVDLQDIGARYYTYHCTMQRCLEACAQSNTHVAVLDRPNPLGGDVVEGPLPTDTSSIVCCAAIPVRHGMTMGELARWYQRTLFRKLRLEVVELDGWRRALHYDACSLPWTPPSPNMPSAQAALLYVGTCLFEGVNLNEGRGTDSPFEVFGAPWLDAAAVNDLVSDSYTPGVRLESVSYTPKSIPGKSTNPRYRDEACNGIRIHIDNANTVRPFTMTLALFAAIRKAHPAHFAWEGQPSFDTLLGGPEIRTAIEAGVEVREIEAGYARALQRFDRNRPRLYGNSGT